MVTQPIYAENSPVVLQERIEKIIDAKQPDKTQRDEYNKLATMYNLTVGFAAYNTDLKTVLSNN